MKIESQEYRDTVHNEVIQLNDYRDKLASEQQNDSFEMDMTVLKDKCLAWAKEDGIDLTEEQVWAVLDYEERYMREIGIVMDVD